MGIVVVLISTLGFSIVGVVTLLVLKRYETVTGRVVLGQARPKVGAFFHTTLVWVESALPSFFAQAIHGGIAQVKKVIHRVVARSIFTLERALERVLRLLHYTTHPPRTGSGEASVFLREIAEHKKKLLTRPSARVTEKK